MRKHYINTVDYVVKTYTTNLSGNKQSTYLLDRTITGYLNQSSDQYTTEGEVKTGKEYEFTCDYSEEIKTGNYIDFEGERYSIKNVSKHKGISLSHTRLTLIKQD